MIEHRGRGVGAAEHGLGQRQQLGRLLGAAGGLQRPVRGQVDHAADRDRDGDEQQQRQQVLRVVDREGVHRPGEVPVQQQAGGDRGEHGGPEPADDRHRDHGDQVDQQVVGQAQVVRPGDQRRGEQRQPGHQEDAGQKPAAADAAEQLGQAKAQRLRSAGEDRSRCAAAGTGGLATGTSCGTIGAGCGAVGPRGAAAGSCWSPDGAGGLCCGSPGCCGPTAGSGWPPSDSRCRSAEMAAGSGRRPAFLGNVHNP